MSKREAVAEKLLNNNPGKKRIQPKAKPTPGRPMEPMHLEPVGLAEWRRLIQALEGSGKLQLSDEGLVLTAALSYQRIQEAEGMISDQGLIVEGDKGVLVKNPACQLARDYNVQYQKALQLLGINAGARPDVPKDSTEEDPHGDLD